MMARSQLPAVLAWIVVLALGTALVIVSSSFADFSFGMAIALFITSAGTVGLLIRLRRPGNVVGRLLAFGPMLLAAGFISYGVSFWRLQVYGPDDVPGGLIGAWAAASTLPGIALTFPAVGIVFPDGRLPGPRWRAPVAIVVALFLASSLIALVTSAPESGLPRNPLAWPGVPEGVVQAGGVLGTVAVIASVLLAAAAVAVRFRRAGGVERQQLKWFGAAIGLVAVLFPISFLTDVGPAGGDAIDVLSVLAAALVPVAVGVAILRYRLYEIDRVVSRTLSWAIVTGILVAVFAAAVIALQALMAGFTQGQTLAVAASTLLAFALFQPLRRRVQDAVDRRFDRARYDAQRTVDSFGRRLRDETDISIVLTDLSRTARSATLPVSLTTWLRPRAGGR
jgi:hypothetical protein